EPVFSLGLKDVPKVRQYLQQLVKHRFSERTSRGEIEQVPIYLLQAGTHARPVTVVFGIVGQQLICTGSPACFAETVRRLRVHQIGLERSERYCAAAKSVAPPTEAFAYLDTKSAFEKVYPTLRPMAILGTAFVPTLAHYVDPFTLPETDEISRYLTPIVFSRRHLPEGTMDESVGPLTAYQAVVFGYGAGLALGLVQSAAN
ncbi:MAG: hypothetical protein JO069_18640, partial [Verrucomicrobia bacterium]|nr:hypothetical protein [Verrucomicrobiota bacterium]